MTEAVATINVLKHEDVQAITDGLEALQCLAFQVAESKGFHDDAPDRRDFASTERGNAAYAQAVTDRLSRRLMLITDEATEGHDEIRSGRGVTEDYYTDSEGSEWSKQAYASDNSTGPTGRPLYKPEGLPSELADIIIRTADLAEEFGIDLGEAIIGKIAYNATRPAMHGKKF